MQNQSIFITRLGPQNCPAKFYVTGILVVFFYLSLTGCSSGNPEMMAREIAYLQCRSNALAKGESAGNPDVQEEIQDLSNEASELSAEAQKKFTDAPRFQRFNETLNRELQKCQ